MFREQDGHPFVSPYRHTVLPRVWQSGILFLVAMMVLAACGSQEPTVGNADLRDFSSSSIAIATEGELLERPDGTLLEVGDMALNFSYTLADGTTQQLSDLRGQKILLNFWATWCGPCRVEMPDIEQAVQMFGDEGFTALAVNHGEEVEVIPPFASELDLTFLLIANPSSDIVNGYAAIGLPTTYFINTDGTISFKQVGVMDFDFIEQRIEEMQ